jgi:hypothetical protein
MPGLVIHMFPERSRYFSCSVVSSAYNNHVALIQRAHRSHHWRRRRAGKGVRSRLQISCCTSYLWSIARYSLYFASRGANVVVNDFNRAAAQKVVDEITKGSSIVHICKFSYWSGGT